MNCIWLSHWKWMDHIQSELDGLPDLGFIRCIFFAFVCATLVKPLKGSKQKVTSNDCNVVFRVFPLSNQASREAFIFIRENINIFVWITMVQLHFCWNIYAIIAIVLVHGWFPNFKGPFLEIKTHRFHSRAANFRKWTIMVFKFVFSMRSFHLNPNLVRKWARWTKIHADDLLNTRCH